MNAASRPHPARAPVTVSRRPLSRRHLLRASGIALALPSLDAMLPASARAAPAAPRRMFAICNNLGLLGEHFFPAGAGREYRPSPCLELLQPHRSDFSVLSGVSHPNVDGGHPADVCFLTCAPHPGSGSFRNTVSLDQHIGERLGNLTRFPSLTLAVNTRSRSLSWTATGVAIPPEDKAASVFRQLFVQGTPEQTRAQIRKLDTGRSILDAIAGHARDLEAAAGPRDRERLDQYFTSVRSLEQRLQASRAWEVKPKPVVKAPVPVDPDSPGAYLEKVRVMYDLARLVFQTDSTRTITLMLDSVATPVVEGLTDARITEGYHNLSHHGRSEEKLRQLKALDLWQMKLLARLFSDFKAAREGGESLLDRTMILYGSNLGDANAHLCSNLPIILAGGGFKHGQHLAFPTDRNHPLANLFVSILQRLGIDEDRFASSTGTMPGLDG
jgi:Protein of unknown function (DUF1552)